MALHGYMVLCVTGRLNRKKGLTFRGQRALDIYYLDSEFYVFGVRHSRIKTSISIAVGNVCIWPNADLDQKKKKRKIESPTIFMVDAGSFVRSRACEPSTHDEWNTNGGKKRKRIDMTPTRILTFYRHRVGHHQHSPAFLAFSARRPFGLILLFVFSPFVYLRLHHGYVIPTPSTRSSILYCLFIAIRMRLHISFSSSNEKWNNNIVFLFLFRRKDK